MAKIGKHRIEVSYPHNGKDLDGIAEKIAGKPCWASGAGFGSRDMSASRNWTWNGL